MPTPEQSIQKEIIEYLKYKPVYSWRNNTGFRGGVHFGKKGSSDILGVHTWSGKFLAIEVKVPGEGPTDDQRKFLNEIHQAGGLCGVATCIEDVDRILAGEFLLPL